MANMNDFIRKGAGRGISAGSDAGIGASGQISPAHEERIAAFMRAGAGYQEARDLVLGYTGPVLAPAGNAGSGRLSNPPPTKTDMNEFLRATTGHFWPGRPGG